MPRTIGIGNQDFSVIRTNDYFYIDKTGFIKEWWDSGDHVTLITRPRRFGQTLTLSMTEQFFSLKFAGRTDLFEGLDIWKEERYREIQGTYPTISLTFANVKDLNNLEVVTTTTEKYESAFGFTQNEVIAALEEFGLDDQKDKVKHWYDGFTFGKIKDIYNPWSIINYLDRKKVGAYWANTSSNGLIGKVIREGSAQMKMQSGA